MKLTWQRNKPHYAWIILASTMALFAISSGVALSFGVLIDPLVEQHGWSRSAISFAYTIQFLTAIPVILVAGRLGEKISSRHIVMAGSIVFTIGALLTATVTQVWQFQLYWGVLIGAGTAVVRPLLPVLLSRWFYRKLGLAIGLMWTSVSLGPAAFSPLIRLAIEAWGWREPFIVFGLIGGALMLVCSLLIRDHPREMNLAPYGGLPSGLESGSSGASVAVLSLRQVMVMTSLWVLIAVHALGCIAHSIPLTHMVSIATFAGVSGIAAAGILSITTATSLISRLGMSLVAEAKGARFTLTLVMLLQTLPILLMLNAGEMWWLYSFAFLFGLGFGGEMVGFPIFNIQYYGRDAPLKTIYAYQMVGASLGMAAGGWLGGALFDWTGAYVWSILVAVAAGVMGMMAAVLLPSRLH